MCIRDSLHPLGMVFIILIFNGLLAQLFSFLIDLSTKLTRVDLCCLRNLFLLELFLVGAGFDVGAEMCIRDSYR